MPAGLCPPTMRVFGRRLPRQRPPHLQRVLRRHLSEESRRASAASCSHSASRLALASSNSASSEAVSCRSETSPRPRFSSEIR
eukprot:10949272-Alexandrium_andersonii.AAC.1